jgi:hypothetical protein
VAIGGGGRTVEVVDVRAGTSKVIETLTQRGSFASLNLIGNDRLLLIGGYDDRIGLRGEVRLIPIDG